MKTTLTVDSKGKLKKYEEKFGDSAEIGKAVKKGDWNKYRITAKGFKFCHYINGVKTTELIDNDMKARRSDGLIALQLHAGPPMKVSFKKHSLDQVIFSKDGKQTIQKNRSP